MGALRERYALWTEMASDAARAVLSTRFLGSAVYGSVGRGTPRETSDIDLLILASLLPAGRSARARIATEIESAFQGAAGADAPELSILLRTPSELRDGSPLVLEIAADGRIVADPTGELSKQIAAWQSRLSAAGARRIHTGDSWHWDLQGDREAGAWEI